MFSAINQDYNLLLSEENQNTEVEDNDNDEELMLNILSDQEEVDVGGTIMSKLFVVTGVVDRA